MPTYYGRADGTATDLVDATSDANAATSLNANWIANGGDRFSPADQVVLSDQGGDWAGMGIPSSGDGGDDLVFRANLISDPSGVDGTPVYDAGEVVATWTQHAGNIWKASLASEPPMVWMDTDFGDRKIGETLTNEFDWVYDESGSLYASEANTLYIYAATDPDARYTEVTAATAQLVMECNSHSYITFRGLTVRKCKGNAFVTTDSDYITMEDCIFEWAWTAGFAAGDNSDKPHDIVLEDCIARHCGEAGIMLANDKDGGGVVDCVVRRCTTYENGRHQYANPVWNFDFNFTAGIKFWGGEGNSNLVEYCHSYNNGPTSDLGNSNQGFGVGIWIDALWATSENENIVQYNSVHDNWGNGIFIEISDYAIVKYNLCYENAKAPGNDEYKPGNIRIDCRYSDSNSFSSSNNKIYNNTIYGGKAGIVVAGYEMAGTSHIDDNEIKNNIAIGYTEYALYCAYGGDNDGTWGSGNIYLNNCFGAEAANFIYWRDSTEKNLDTYDEWETEYGDTTSSIEEDPEYNDVGSDEYWLTAGSSPCIDTGEDLGADHDDGLAKSSTWVDSVSTLDQDDYGGGWDLGAYVDEGDGSVTIIGTDVPNIVIAPAGLGIVKANISIIGTDVPNVAIAPAGLGVVTEGSGPAPGPESELSFPLLLRRRLGGKRLPGYYRAR